MAKQHTPLFNSNTILGLIAAALLLMVLFVLARGIFWLLSLLAPIFLIATLFIDHKVFLSYGRWVGRLVKRNFLWGLLVIVLSLVGYPLVAALLFGQAWMNWQLKDGPSGEERDQYVEFQEVEELELKPPQKRETTRHADFDDYEELFG